MELLRLADFRPSAGAETFAWSGPGKLVPVGIFLGLTGFSGWQLLAPQRLVDMPTFAWCLMTGTFALFTWVALAQARAAFGPNSWVAVVDRDRLWLKLRSPLNARLGQPDDLQVVSIPFSQLVWSQPVLVQTLSTHAGENKTDSANCLELGLSEPASGQLAQALAAERASRRNTTSHGHSPVQLIEPERIRLDLYSVPGGPTRLQAALPPSVERRNPRSENIDLR